MTAAQDRRIALLYPGDRAARDRADPGESRFARLFHAFEQAGISPEPAVYRDDFRDEVRDQLLKVHAVLVWHNPVENDRDRSLLDQMLGDVSRHGIVVSTHPDTIQQLGTKDILLETTDLPFGSDAWRIADLQQLESQLRDRLTTGPRVLKQRRGHSGIGVWRVERTGEDRYSLRHAQRGSRAELMGFADVLARLSPYFEHGAHMIDQAWQPRMVEGMTRAYLVGDRVAGFGHQAVVALHPDDADGNAVPTSTRFYSAASDPRFQDLRQRLEGEWIGLLIERLGLDRRALPLLWDADFLLGNRTTDVERHVLCEINVSSVAPFPDSVIPALVEATGAAVATRRSPSLTALGSHR